MRTWGMVAGVLGALAVGLGAFGAHALKGRLDERMLNAWETATKYHFYHALALLVIALAAGRLSPKAREAAAWLLVVGIALFSGSLYAMALSGVTALGAITPVGGLCLIAGWLTLGWAARRPG